VPYFGDMINGEPELRMRFLAFKMDKAVSGGPAVSPEIRNRPIRPMLPAPGPVELREKRGDEECSCAVVSGLDASAARIEYR